MNKEMGRDPVCLYALTAAVLLSGLVASGCGKDSADQAINRVSRETGVQRVPIAKISGTVTVNGKEPPVGTLIALYDPKSASGPKGKMLPLYTLCKPDGRFQFGTYGDGDGVPVGSYIILFAQLQYLANGGYFPPDGFKNLYNDPDKNTDKAEFKVDVTDPGRTDYRFDLTVEGKEPVTDPGPHALIKITF
jgi:hypothetical protein